LDYFVDKLENSGLVYGEILHDIVYKFMTNVRLTIQNGLIYDFKKNVWVESFNVGELVSEANKIYHIADIHIRNLKRHKEYQTVFQRTIDAIKSTIEPNDIIIEIDGDDWLLHPFIFQYLYQNLIIVYEFINSD
jgi:hypothetical protein